MKKEQPQQLQSTSSADALSVAREERQMIRMLDNKHRRQQKQPEQQERPTISRQQTPRTPPEVKDDDDNDDDDDAGPSDSKKKQHPNKHNNDDNHNDNNDDASQGRKGNSKDRQSSSRSSSSAFSPSRSSSRGKLGANIFPKRSTRTAKLGHSLSMMTLKALHNTFYKCSGWFETHFSRLDDMLGGGISTGEVLEVAGETSIGKTQLCMMVAARLAWISDESIAYIDTANTFCPRRFKQMYDFIATARDDGDDGGMSRGGEGNDDRDSDGGNTDTAEGKKAKSFSTAGSQIRVFRSCSNAFALNTLLQTFQQKMEAQEESYFKRLRLVIIDSLSGILAPLLGTKQPQGHAVMQETARFIKSLAFKHHLAVLTTCHTVSTKENPLGLKPALGESWTYFADRRLAMYFNPENKKQRIAALVKSNETSTGQVMFFEIGKGGLMDSPANDDDSTRGDTASNSI